jgi:acyl-CoA synthetase (AMP-forming)/AMP-acid ligase II
MAEPSLTTLLQRRANQQPGDTAYTFIDYDLDPAGVAQSLTWAQLQTLTDSRASLINPSPETPGGPWLRTGDLGVISDDELFFIGRIKASPMKSRTRNSA